MIPLTYFLHEYYLLPVLDKTLLYRFETIITDFSNKRRVVERTFTRDVELIYLGKKKELFVFDVFTKKITFNSNQTIENERLLKEAAYAFDEIEMGVNDKGEILTIYNLMAMKHRWEETKFEIRKDNFGYELDDFLSTISNILNDEEQLVSFLNTNKMFGLYFHGLFGKNDMYEVPKTRIAIIPEFDGIEITEQIWTDNRIPRFVIEAKKNIGIEKKIVSKNDQVKKYQGELMYTKDNQLLEGIIETEDENMNIKHTVLWVG
jgi:hypothetical protein